MGDAVGAHRLVTKKSNNVLTVLSVLLKKAVEWDVIERVPCTIRLVRAPKPSMGFYGLRGLRAIARRREGFGPTASLVMLLGGEADFGAGR